MSLGAHSALTTLMPYCWPYTLSAAALTASSCWLPVLVPAKPMVLALIVPVRDYVNLNGFSSQVMGLRYDRQGWFPWLHDVYLSK